MDVAGKKSKSAKTGPEPARVKIKGPWERAVGAVLTGKKALKKTPAKGGQGR